MNVALVENSEDDIHNEECGQDEKRERLEQLLKDQAFPLKLPFHCRRKSFCRRLLNKRGNISQSHSRFCIKAKGYARKLVQVVNGLETERRLRLRHRANRNKSSTNIGLDVN